MSKKPEKTAEPVTLTAREARALTDRIKAAVAAAWELIVDAYQRQAWAALDYESWDAYCITEFGTSRLRLPREERPEMVRSLREAGLSIRAIGSATGLGKSTIQREIEGVPNGTGGAVIGRDGKSYRRKPPRPRPETLRERQDRQQRERQQQERDVDLFELRARLLNADGDVILNRAEARRVGAALPGYRQLDLDVDPLPPLPDLGEPGTLDLDDPDTRSRREPKGKNR
jgi:hypothetical protein